jgi:plasmid stabilization system protein ParE
MSLPVAHLPEAQDDVDEAYAGYEQRAAGLGERFLEVLRDQFDQIQANPELYGVLHRDVRAAPLRRFPYVVYYRVETDRILVVAVQHGRRSSRAWQGRV